MLHATNMIACEQSRSVSNSAKRKDATRSRPSTSETGSKENVNLRNAISYLEKYTNIRECESETEASDCYNEESDKEQVPPELVQVGRRIHIQMVLKKTR